MAFRIIFLMIIVSRDNSTQQELLPLRWFCPGELLPEESPNNNIVLLKIHLLHMDWFWFIIKTTPRNFFEASHFEYNF